MKLHNASKRSLTYMEENEAIPSMLQGLGWRSNEGIIWYHPSCVLFLVTYANTVTPYDRLGGKYVEMCLNTLEEFISNVVLMMANNKGFCDRPINEEEAAFNKKLCFEVERFLRKNPENIKVAFSTTYYALKG